MGHGPYIVTKFHGSWAMQHCTTHDPWVVEQYPVPMPHGLYNGIHSPWGMGCTMLSMSHGSWLVQHYPFPMGHVMDMAIFRMIFFELFSFLHVHAPYPPFRLLTNSRNTPRRDKTLLFAWPIGGGTKQKQDMCYY